MMQQTLQAKSWNSTTNGRNRWPRRSTAAEERKLTEIGRSCTVPCGISGTGQIPSTSDGAMRRSRGRLGADHSVPAVSTQSVSYLRATE